MSLDSGITILKNGTNKITNVSNRAQIGTIGLKPDPLNMPLTKNGTLPDIIINPKCIPTRMTIGQLFEIIESNDFNENNKIEKN